MTEIHLSDKDKAFIEAQVKSGAYDNADDVIAAGLNRLGSDDEELRAMIAEADAQLERGEFVAFANAEDHAEFHHRAGDADIEPKELIYAPLADQDLLDIFLYIAADDPAAASHFVRDLTRKIEWIALSSFSGSPRDDLSPGLKALPYRKRCIYFPRRKQQSELSASCTAIKIFPPTCFKTDEN